MKINIAKTWRRGFFATVLFSGAVLWLVGGDAQAVEQAETMAEPVIAGQQKVLYRDCGDEISVIGEGIQSITYSSANRNVAVVSQEGIVSGVDQGKTEIQVKVQYGDGENIQTKDLSYELTVIDNFTNYFDVSNGVVNDLTEKGRTLKEMYIPDYCNYIKVKSAAWEKLLSKNHVVEKLFLSDYINKFCRDGIGDAADAPQRLKELHLGKGLTLFGNIYGVTTLEKITVHPENEFFEVRDNVVLFFLMGEDRIPMKPQLACYPAGRKDASYSVPEDVSAISSYAFSGAKNLASVSLPAGLEVIGEEAFANSGLTEISIPTNTILDSNVFLGCEKLQKVLLPNRAASAWHIFNHCPALKTVIVPNTAESICGYIFEDCPSLQEFQISAGTSDYQVEDGVLFKKSTQTLAVYPAGKTNTSYTVPAGIKCIGWGAFYGAAKLKSIKLDAALTAIESAAFTDCSSLTKIHIPQRVESIYASSAYSMEWMFRGCRSLKEITVASQNKKYASAKGVLYNKSKKYLYCYPQGKKGSKFTVPKKVTTIKACAFAENRYLQKVVMGNKVSLIEERAFYHAVSLKSVALPSKLKKMSTEIFDGCKKLTKIKLPNGIVSLRDRMFADCTSLKEVVVGTAFKEFGSQAFYNCKSLRKVTFKGKKWLSKVGPYKYNSGKMWEPFYKAGSKNYSKLVIKVPKCTKAQKKKCKKILSNEGLNKKAKIKFAK